MMKTLTAKRFHWKKTGALLALAFLSLLVPSTMRADSLYDSPSGGICLLADIDGSAERTGFWKNPNAGADFLTGLMPWIIALAVFLGIFLIVMFHPERAKDFTKQDQLHRTTTPFPTKESSLRKKFVRIACKILASLTYLILPYASLALLGWSAFCIMLYIALIPSIWILSGSDSDETGEKGTWEPEELTPQENKSQRQEKIQESTLSQKMDDWLDAIGFFLILGVIIVQYLLYIMTEFPKPVIVGIWLIIASAFIWAPCDKKS